MMLVALEVVSLRNSNSSAVAPIFSSPLRFIRPPPKYNNERSFV